MTNNIFTFFDKLDLDNHIEFLHINENGKEQSYKLSHEKFDGASGLIHLLKEQGSDLNIEASSFKRNEKSILRKVMYFWINIVSYLKCDLTPNKEKYFSHLENSNKNTISRFFYFDENEINKIKELALKERVNLNTFILVKINSYLCNAYNLNNSINRWMLPVSLYRDSQQRKDAGNNSSFIEVQVNNGNDFILTHSQITKKLNNLVFLAPMYMEKILFRLPNFIILKVLKEHFKKNKRIGTFSNLGNWKVDGLSGKEKWGFCAPVMLNQPISCSILTVNNNLCFGLKFYKSIDGNLDKIDIKEVILK